MPFRLTVRSADVQQALTDQGYTTGRAGSLDNLDAAVSTRAAPGAAMDINATAESKVKTQGQSALTDQGYTIARAPNLDNLDASISSRAAPGSAMDIVAAAREAIWNELIPGTPALGSFGEKVKSNLDAAVSSRANGGAYTDGRAANLDNIDALISSRAAPGSAMDLVAAAKAEIWEESIPGTPAVGSFGERVKDNLDAVVSSRATPSDVDTQLGSRGITTTRMAKLDNVSAPASNSDSVAAGSNSAGLTVQLDTGYRTVVEVRYSCGAAADFFVEGSDDGSTWYEGDSFSESGAATDKVVGYLSARRYIRMRSPTTGIDLSFELVALL